MSSERVPEKARGMVDYIRERICVGDFASGNKLPSMRTLQERFDLSFTSVKGGIDYLCGVGLLEMRPRSGVYVKRGAEPDKSAVCRIALFAFAGELRSSGGVYSTVFLGLQRFAEGHGISLMVDCIPRATVTIDSINTAAKGADAIIFMSEYDATLSDLSSSVPAVGVCMHDSFGGKISVVDIDPYQTAKLAVDYFSEKEVDTVVLVFRDDLPPSYLHRQTAFADLWRANGGIIEEISVADDPRFLSDNGYFFATSSMLQECSLKSLEDHGKILSERVTVLGVDGKNLINPDFHAAPCVALDWQLVGQCAMEECLRRINNPGVLPRRIYLPGKMG